MDLIIHTGFVTDQNIFYNLHYTEIEWQYDKETNKTNSQNSIYYWIHILLVLRALDFGKSVDITTT